MLRPVAASTIMLAMLLAGYWPASQGAPAPFVQNRLLVANSIGMKLKRIPPGKYMRGSPATESQRSPNEGPQHEVRISRPFYMGVYEVTQAEYQKVMGRNPSHCSPTGPGSGLIKGVDHNRLPVENLSWEEARDFCVKLSALPAERSARRTYRLPTEAEWEYACRAGTTTVFAFGNSLSSKQANFIGSSPYGGAPAGVHRNVTTVGGTFAPNAWGLYDMHGNVAEWVADWMAPYAAGPVTDPTGPATGTSRIVRDGAWGDPANLCRSARRTAFSPTSRLAAVGFRVVCIVER